jgi:hypothetical protein
VRTTKVHDIPDFIKRYLQWLEAAEPYTRGYARIAREFPQHMWRFKEIGLPIQREIFGTEEPRASLTLL